MAQTFQWNSSFETGLADVDSQHRRLVDTINAIGERLALSADIDAAELKDLYQDLKDYAAYHFAEEETLMAGAGIHAAHLERHRDQHAYYISEIERLCRDCSPERPETGQGMLRFLTSWLAYHILGTDQAMARQMAYIAAGMDPENALATEEHERRTATEPLLHALQGLFEQLSERNRQLVALNETLEQRVAERTAELTSTVARLEVEKAESLRLGRELAMANRHLEELAMTDVLTGLPNRRHAMAQLERFWGEAGAAGQLAVIMVDADGFKPVNDTWGHDAGDAVLQRLARELTAALRSDDTVCRMGGDEFLIICPATPLAGAQQVAEVTWRRVNALRVPVGDGEWRGSISVGVAARTPAMAGVSELLKAADEAVYAAKAAGRNCVRSAA